MKKLLLLFLLLSILCTSFMGCAGTNESEPSEYVITKAYNESSPSYEEDVTSYQLFVTSPMQEYYFLDTEKYGAIEVYDKVNIYVDGQKKTLSYIENLYYNEHYRNYRHPEFYPTYRYRDADGNDYVFEGDGTLVGYYTGLREDCSDKISKDEAGSIAKEFFGLVNDKIDLAKYECTSGEVCGDNGYYYFDYYKVIGGYKTSEYIYFTVDYSGKVHSYNARMLGKIPDDIDIDSIDFDLIDEMVKEKLDEMYQDKQEYADNIIFNTDYVITILKTGNIGVKASTEVEFVYGNITTPDEVVTMIIIVP
ncbi:MAG: hypothetical protein ACI3XI_03305 [Eubacteriales bacterium]